MALPPSLRRLWTLVRRPGEFFEYHPPAASLGGPAAVVFVVACATTLGVAAIGWWFSSSIHATETVTTMEPWSNATCESFAAMNESTNHSSIPEPCTIYEPRTKQVDVGATVWDAFAGRLPWVFVGVFAGWLIVAAVLHALSALYDAEGSFAGTLAVVGWATLLDLVRVAVVVAGAYVLLRGVSFTGDPEAMVRQLRQVTDGAGGHANLVGVGVVAWQAYIWTHGLRYARDLRRGEAAVVAGVVGFVAILFALAG